MLKQQFLQELESGRLMLHSSGYNSIEYVYNAIHNNTFVPEIIQQTIASTRGELFNNDSPDAGQNPFDAWGYDSIAVIPLAGIMMKYDYWWGYGVDEIAGIIRMAFDSDRISSVIVKGDTPGGNTDSIFLLQEVLAKKRKPCYGYIDGMCASCGYIAFSYMDKIYSINDMARVGGIGVFARMVVPTSKDAYYKVVEAYPDESKDKNYPERELAKGNDEPMKEVLSKLAVYYQGIVKANRPQIAAETLTGKTYYSVEAIPLGMIDGIKTLSEVIGELTTLTENRKQILSIL